MNTLPDNEYDIIDYEFDDESERGLIGDYARRLYYWYVNNYLFYTGDLKVVGHPDYRVGDRLYYTNETDGINWEFYIESIEHSFTLTEGYTTTIGVTRGLKVSSPTDDGIRFRPPAGEPQEFEGGYLGEISITSLREASTEANNNNINNPNSTGSTVTPGNGPRPIQ